MHATPRRIAVYAVVPIWMGVLAVGLWRRRGTGPPMRVPLPGWVRGALAIQVAILLVVGTLLLVTPLSIARAWPWELTPLTGRAIGAWLVGIAVCGVHAILERDVGRVLPALATYLAFPVLQGTALLRFPDDVRWGTAGAWAYLAFLVLAGVTAAVAVMAWLRGDVRVRQG